eukprot:293814-Karenia_brevis.AAC.1
MGVRQCATCHNLLQCSMMYCPECGSVTFSVKPDGTAHLQSLYGAERLLSWIMMEATNYGSQIKIVRSVETLVREMMANITMSTPPTVENESH